jgi:hypothetical protein
MYNTVDVQAMQASCSHVTFCLDDVLDMHLASSAINNLAVHTSGKIIGAHDAAAAAMSLVLREEAKKCSNTAVAY